jgi:hypothetical protein
VEFGTGSQAQESRQFEIRGKTEITGDALFFAEIHGIHDENTFKPELLKFAVEKCNTYYIALEIGKSEAYLYNSYLKDGDTTLFVQYPGNEVRAYFKKWKQIYDTHPFTVVGIDFERLEFVVALKSILNKNPEAQNTGLSRFLFSLPDTLQKVEGGIGGHKLRIEIYEQAREKFETGKDTLKSVIKNGYGILEEIMENPATERGMKKRDVTMTENLSRLKGKKFLCILGASHLRISDKKSLLSKYIKENGTEKVSLIEMACKNCYNTSYYGEMFFEMNVGSDSKGKKVNTISASYDKYYNPKCYTLVAQEEFMDLKEKWNPFPTYYILFRDQPKMGK